MRDHLDLLGLQPADRQECEEVLGTAGGRDVAAAVAALRLHLGAVTENSKLPDYPERTWIAALLRFVPELLERYRARNVPAEIVADSLADWGRHFALHRRVHGDFGLETWRWIALHARGTMFQLGRLQFMLYRPEILLPGVEEGSCAWGIHIPETGAPLDAAAVDEAFVRARKFFALHFPETPASFTTCESWMLDPGLRSELPDTSNVARFADRFTLLDRRGTDPTDALYFVFRTRDTNSVASLPRTSSVQRAVLNLYDAGTPVLGTAGYFRL